MRILLTNDDGILAPGLRVLEGVARELSDDIWVVAPELDQSGASHSLTLRDPLRVRQVAEKKYAVNGTPTDCVLLTIRHLLKDHPPDLVLSGINYGSNLAEDITYSGTVAAAMEAVLLNTPAIALSLVHENGKPPRWETVEAHGVPVLKQALTYSLNEDIFLNINFPDCSPDAVAGIKITQQGKRKLDDNLEERLDPRGKSYFWIGLVTHSTHHQPGSDLECIRENKISITPLSMNLTHYPTLSILQEALENE